MKPNLLSVTPNHALVRYLLLVIHDDGDMQAVLKANPPARIVAWLVPRMPELLLDAAEAGVPGALEALNEPSAHEPLARQLAERKGELPFADPDPPEHQVAAEQIAPADEAAPRR